MNSIARLLIAPGSLLLLVGIVLLALGKLGLPLGRLPGDIAWRGRNSQVYFPITTCILISVLLSLLLYVFGKFRQ